MWRPCPDGYWIYHRAIWADVVVGSYTGAVSFREYEGAMKASQMFTNRFSSPSPLDPTTMVRGSTVAEWEAAFTNGFKHTLAELTERKKEYLLKRARMTPFNGVFRRNNKVSLIRIPK